MPSERVGRVVRYDDPPKIVVSETLTESCHRRGDKRRFGVQIRWEVSMTTESLTYREMADRMGIKLDSARRLTLRRKWQKTMGNDGAVRVMVPSEALERPTDVETDSPPVIGTDIVGDDTPVIRAPSQVELQLRIEGLKAIVESERRRADAAEADRDAWRAQAQRGLWSRMFG